MHNVHPCSPDLRVRELVASGWGADYVGVQTLIPYEFPGFVVMEENAILGLATYLHAGSTCELVTLDSLNEGQGIGSMLLEAVVDEARHAGASRSRVVKTNDNLRALRFCQKRGFRLVARGSGEVDRSRRLKPIISELSCDGIPVRDEVELELLPG